MRIFKLTDGILTTALPTYRYVHRSQAKPGLSFTHPVEGPANWRVVLPLGARDFYGEQVPCPTNATHSKPALCRWCGKTVDGEGNCHGAVPAMPAEDQEYHLFRLPVRAGEPVKACDYILTLPENDQQRIPSKLILWDDSGLGDTVGYAIDGHAKYIGYGHDADDVSITVYPVVLITGKARLISHIPGTGLQYDFDEQTALQLPSAQDSQA